MKTHHLKTWALYWDAVADGDKLFEVRKNDRFFQRGDIVELHRWNESEGCYEDRAGEVSSSYEPVTGGTLRFRIGDILQGGQFGIEPGYCVFSLQPDEAGSHDA